jgi:hypothetical protein
MKVAACKSDMTTCGDGKVRTAVPIGTNRMYVPCVPQRAISDSKKSISSSIPVAMVVRPSPCLYHYKGKNRLALGHGKGVAFEVRTRAVGGLTFGRIVLQRGFHAARKRRWGVPSVGPSSYGTLHHSPPRSCNDASCGGLLF